MRFDGLTKEDVVRAYYKLECENEQLNEKVRSLDKKLENANFRIEQELSRELKRKIARMIDGFQRQEICHKEE